MNSRREFLGSIGIPAFAVATGIPLFPPRLRSAPRLQNALATHHDSPTDAAGDEEFWGEIARSFTVDRSLVNLNNGGVSPSPAFVQDAMKRHLDYSNEAPVYTMWRILEPQREAVRKRLAREWSVDAEEIALTRNASEGLQICQLGFDLERGDEVLTTNQDYPRMLTTFRQRERREGIVLREISIPVPAEDPAEVVRRFEAAITPRTRLILVCHVINLTGQILPVREVVELGRRHDIPVIVDGAHALAHFDFTLAELDCDYYAVSLHKWLCAPHGTGLLYVRRERIANLWPMQAADERLDADIRKFEEIGTHPAANYLAIAEALTFHQAIGAARKEARLRYLRDSWARPLLDLPGVTLHTSLDPRYSCGFATVEIEGIEPAELTSWLWREHRIITTPIVHPEFRGIRVSSSVYTTPEEIGRFVDAMTRAARRGIEA
ncbi:MAG: aminotransferase class V-fold PLP-dependent enzyme [marine benthic group bacterium]|nr:aminotransferase class V-fold PLP-dependent enzyme [Gemmatimonadota bacterium]